MKEKKNPKKKNKTEKKAKQKAVKEIQSLEKDTKKNAAIITGCILLLFSILFLVSVYVDYYTIESDYLAIKSANLTFFEIIKLNFPDVNHPVGVFGVLSSYAIYYVFGGFFGKCFFLGLIIISIFLLFLKNKTEFVLKAIYFIIFSLLINILLISFQLTMDSGLIPTSLYGFLYKLFNSTGTRIITGFLIILSLILIFEMKNIKELVKIILSLFAKKEEDYLEESITVVEKKSKKRKNKIETEEEPVYEKCLSQEPKITDHKQNLIDQREKEAINISEDKKRVFRNTSKPDRADSEQTEFDEYVIPNIDEFLTSQISLTTQNRKELESSIKKTSKLLLEKLLEFGIEAEVINVNIGPIITQFEIEPAPGVKVSRFQSLADDLALAIKAKNIRVQAPIPGRGLIGIEIPNKDRDIIYLKDILLSDEMVKSDEKLMIALGKDISGFPIIANLAKMPHLLIAGATGSGKSVCVNTLINSLLLRVKPDEVRLVMIDPKRIELSGYEGIPHLIQNVVTDPDKALAALNWGVSEMERRYELLQKYTVRDIRSYNTRIKKLKKDNDEIEDQELPFIVIIVDEFADLMMTAGREIEMPIARLAQMARAVGIHLILATQRPSTKVITGIIKANFPARIAFQVSSKIDSRVILDSNGAERLLGRGDMLFLPPGKALAERIHGAFMSDDEIENLVEYLKLMPKPEQEIEMITEAETDLEVFDYDDDLFPEAARAIVYAQTASVSMLQRHFKIGYARAGRLVDMLEKAGIVGPHVGSKSREVIATEDDLVKYGF